MDQISVPQVTEMAPKRAPSQRVLVAGIGNVLRGDDGFGPAVIQALQSVNGLPDGVHAVEVGIGGISLVHELMDGYDALIVVDAVDRGGALGSLYILEPEVPDVATIPALERRELAADMHQTVPGPALTMARAVGVLPPVVRIIGCQPAETEDFSTELSPSVQRAVPQAVESILTLVLSLRAQQK
ncbi:MAG: hydrogenase maturation protease [Chloroflexota bacterium]|nr:hydrogenase maturation protease [Chloroflexota bacterium]